MDNKTPMMQDKTKPNRTSKKPTNCVERSQVKCQNEK